MFECIPPSRLIQWSVPSSAHRWHRHAFWYCSPLAITSVQSNLRLMSGQFWVKITGFSTKMSVILDFFHFCASSSGVISQEYDIIQCILVSIWHDSNVHLPTPTYIHSGQRFWSELLLILLGAQECGSTCPGQPGFKGFKFMLAPKFQSRNYCLQFWLLIHDSSF
jgi:hypothetical protein